MAVINNLPSVSQGMKKELLWTNPNPSSQMNTLNVTIPTIRDYDYILIKYKINQNTSSLTEVINKVSDIAYTTGQTVSKIGSMTGLSGNNIYYREFHITNDVLGFYKGRNMTSETWVFAASICIPVEVYGVKGEIK